LTGDNKKKYSNKTVNTFHKEANHLKDKNLLLKMSVPAVSPRSNFFVRTVSAFTYVVTVVMNVIVVTSAVGECKTVLSAFVKIH
jgi:hypothetical protein